MNQPVFVLIKQPPFNKNLLVRKVANEFHVLSDIFERWVLFSISGLRSLVWTPFETAWIENS